MNIKELLKAMAKNVHLYNKGGYSYFLNKSKEICRVSNSSIKELESLTSDDTLYVFDGNGFSVAPHTEEGSNLIAQSNMFECMFDEINISAKILKEVANFKEDKYANDTCKHLYLDKDNNRVVATTGHVLNVISDVDLSYLKHSLPLPFNTIVGLKETSLISYAKDDNKVNYKIKTGELESIVIVYNFSYYDIQCLLKQIDYNVVKLGFDLQSHKFTKKDYLAYDKDGKAGVYLLNTLTKNPDENNVFIKGDSLDLTTKSELGGVFGEKLAELMGEAESLWIYDTNDFMRKPILVKYKDGNKLSLVMPLKL